MIARGKSINVDKVGSTSISNTLINLTSTHNTSSVTLSNQNASEGCRSPSIEIYFFKQSNISLWGDIMWSGWYWYWESKKKVVIVRIFVHQFFFSSIIIKSQCLMFQASFFFFFLVTWYDILMSLSLFKTQPTSLTVCCYSPECVTLEA